MMFGRSATWPARSTASSPPHLLLDKHESVPGIAVHPRSPSGQAMPGRRRAPLPPDRSGIATTMPCARASSRPSNANCLIAGGSGLMPKPEWPSSSSSRVGTVHDGATPPSDICHPSTTKGASYPPLAQIHNCPRNRGNSKTSQIQLRWPVYYAIYCRSRRLERVRLCRTRDGAATPGRRSCGALAETPKPGQLVCDLYRNPSCAMHGGTRSCARRRPAVRWFSVAMTRKKCISTG